MYVHTSEAQLITIYTYTIMLTLPTYNWLLFGLTNYCKNLTFPGLARLLLSLHLREMAIFKVENGSKKD